MENGIYSMVHDGGTFVAAVEDLQMSVLTGAERRAIAGGDLAILPALAAGRSQPLLGYTGTSQLPGAVRPPRPTTIADLCAVVPVWMPLAELVAVGQRLIIFTGVTEMTGNGLTDAALMAGNTDLALRRYRPTLHAGQPLFPIVHDGHRIADPDSLFISFTTAADRAKFDRGDLSPLADLQHDALLGFDGTFGDLDMIFRVMTAWLPNAEIFQSYERGIQLGIDTGLWHHPDGELIDAYNLRGADGELMYC